MRHATIVVAGFRQSALHFMSDLARYASAIQISFFLVYDSHTTKHVRLSLGRNTGNIYAYFHGIGLPRSSLWETKILQLLRQRRVCISIRQMKLYRGINCIDVFLYMSTHVKQF
jgi:hypothetical protein